MYKLFCHYRNFPNFRRGVFQIAGPEGAMEAGRHRDESIPLQGANEASDALRKGRDMALRAEGKFAALEPHKPKTPGDDSRDSAASAAPERTRWPSDINTSKIEDRITSGRYAIEEGKSGIRFRSADGSVITHLGAGKKVDIQDGAKYDVGGVTFVKAIYRGKEGYIADNFLSPADSSVNQSSTAVAQDEPRPAPSLPASDAELTQLADEAVQAGQWRKGLSRTDTDESDDSVGGKT